MPDYTASDYGYNLTGDTGAIQAPIDDFLTLPVGGIVSPINPGAGFFPEDTGGQTWSEWFQNAANVLIAARLAKQGVQPGQKVGVGDKGVTIIEGQPIKSNMSGILFVGAAVAVALAIYVAVK